MNKKIILNDGLKYEVIEGPIPLNYSIWNAWEINQEGHTFLKLYNENEVIDFHVNTSTLKAIEVLPEDAKIIMSACGAGIRNPKELKKALRSRSNYMQKKALIMKPYIEKLFGIKEMI